MILGVLAITALLVMRILQEPAPLALPAQITLPDGTVPVALTVTPHWYGVVTGRDEILIFDHDGRQIQAISVTHDAE